MTLHGVFMVNNNTTLQSSATLENNTGSYMLCHEWAVNTNCDTRQTNVFSKEQAYEFLELSFSFISLLQVCCWGILTAAPVSEVMLDLWRRKMPVLVVTPLWVCGALKRAIQVLSAVEVVEADLGHACIRARNIECWQVLRVQWLAGWSTGCWGRVTSAPVWVSRTDVGQLHQGSVSLMRRCELVERKGSIAHSSAVAQHVDSGEDWVSRCSVLTGWGPGVDQWLHCGQREPGSVVGSVCPVRRCAPMQSASNVYSLMVGY